MMLKRLLTAVLLISLIVAFLVGCPIRWMTHLPCPGCGMTRACLAAFRLDFTDAFRYHPLFPMIFLAVCGLAAFAIRYKIRNGKRIKEMRLDDVGTIFARIFDTKVGIILAAFLATSFTFVYIVRWVVTLRGLDSPLDFRVVMT
jgi:hypothetical protein